MSATMAEVLECALIGQPGAGLFVARAVAASLDKGETVDMDRFTDHCVAAIRSVPRERAVVDPDGPDAIVVERPEGLSDGQWGTFRASVTRRFDRLVSQAGANR